MGLDSDAFNRADSTTNPGATSASRTWSSARGTWGITSNALYTSASNTTGQGAILVTDFGDSDATLSIDAAARTGNIVQLGLVFRYVDLNNHWYWVVYRDNGANPKYFLIKRVAGSDTTVATGSLANNNACTVSVELSGSSIVGKVDGSSIASTSDSALSTATSFGCNIYGTTTHTLDNFAYAGGRIVSGTQSTETDTANAGMPLTVGSQAEESDDTHSTYDTWVVVRGSAASASCSGLPTWSDGPLSTTGIHVTGVLANDPADDIEVFALVGPDHAINIGFYSPSHTPMAAHAAFDSDALPGDWEMYGAWGNTLSELNHLPLEGDGSIEIILAANPNAGGIVYPDTVVLMVSESNASWPRSLVPVFSSLPL